MDRSALRATVKKCLCVQMGLLFWNRRVAISKVMWVYFPFFAILLLTVSIVGELDFFFG